MPYLFIYAVYKSVMPTNVGTLVNKPIDKIGNAGSFIVKAIPWIIGLGILGLIIWFFFFRKDKRLEKAFGRRRIELETGAKLSKDPSVKFVYVWQDGFLKKIGKYAGHIIIEKKVYVLLTKHFIIDLFLRQKLIVAPKGAMKEIHDGKHKNLLLVGEGFTFDISKDMYILNGEWKWLNVKVSQELLEKNNLELLEDYSNKMGIVFDQVIETTDIDLKRKLKTGEDVVNEPEQ